MQEKKSITLKELASLTNSKLVGDGDHSITDVDSLESARSEDASFLANLKYKELIHSTQAGVICVHHELPLAEGKNYLVSDNPSLTFQHIIELLLITPYNSSGFTEIHHTAVIHPSARLGRGVQIAPYVVIDQGAEIGDYSQLGAHVSIGSGVKIGAHCLFHPHVTVREKAVIGNRVILQPGCVIGSCGFGYTATNEGTYQKLDQLGIVAIEDDVEIGANTTVDRARFKQTIISEGTKIDNLVQIAHNVCLGKHNIIISQSGIAGSVKTGKNVVLGGQAGIVGHLEITDGVMIATRGGVSKSLLNPGKYAGGPVMTLAEHNRQQVHLRKISSYVKQIDSLEKRVKELEEKLKELTCNKPVSFEE